MLRCVPGRRDDPQDGRSQVDLGAVVHGDVLELGARRPRHQDRSLKLGELQVPRDEVVVQMRVRREPDRQISLAGSFDDPADVAGRVHDQARPAAQIDQMGRVAEALVHDRRDVQRAHPLRHPRERASRIGRSVNRAPTTKIAVAR